MEKRATSKNELFAAIVIVVVVFVFVAILLFVGDLTFTLGDDALVADASGWSDLSVKYDDIGDVEFRDELNYGTRRNGYGTSVLQMGKFRNDEFGDYIRYSYAKTKACIVIDNAGNTLVISDKTDEDTKLLYDGLLEKLGR